MKPDLIASFLTKYFWLGCVIVTCINAAILKYNLSKSIKDAPESAAEYSKFIRGFLFWMNVPWLVMGVGCTIGHVSLFQYFQPREGNPFVMAWWVTVFILWVLSVYWVFFMRGAETLAKYKVFMGSYPGGSGAITSPLLIKLFFLLMLAGGIIAAIVMWMSLIPVPDFIK